MTDPRGWIGQRRPPAPDSLRRAILDALDRATADAGTPLADRLADAALETLARVAAAPSSRELALDLLAADALLTYACEAAAEAGDDAVLRLTGERLGPHAFGRLLDREAEG